MDNSPINFGVLTVSDSCSSGEKEDQSGPQLVKAVQEAFKNAQIKFKRIVPDYQLLIEEVLKEWSSECQVVLTTGGTGFGPKDVTPEATKKVIEREAPGLAYAMISKSLQITDMAMLSRAVCGIKSKCVIINLPGSPKGAVECFQFIQNALPHAVHLLNDNLNLVAECHKEVHKNKKLHNKHLNTNSSEVSSQSKVKIDVSSRPRVSPYPIITVEEAKQIIYTEVSPTMILETIPIQSAVNRILAEDVIAEENVPNFPMSMKDGYAINVSTESNTAPKPNNTPGWDTRRSNSSGWGTMGSNSSFGYGTALGAPPSYSSATTTVSQPVIISVRNSVAAGDKPLSTDLKTGEAIRINTGGVLPKGANAVVMVENTKLLATDDNGKEKSIEITNFPKPGQDIRQIGSDIRKGTKIFSKGDILTYAHLGVLATLGKQTVKVFGQPSVAIISTGNEVVPLDSAIEPGQIRDSNKLTLIYLLKKYGFEATDWGIAPDNPDKIKTMLADAFQEHDFIITSGGVSMGEFDLLREVLIKDFDAFIHFARVDMKPGKPTTFATLLYKGRVKYIFGLPGNPVSATVTCLLYVIPTLRRYVRSSVYEFPVINCTLMENISNNDQRPEYVRVVLKHLENGEIMCASTGNQVSSRLNSMVNASGLLHIQPKTLDLALNRVLAEDIFSNDNVPNHDVSLVNGYAMDSTFRRRDSYINSQNNYNNSQNNYNNSQRTYNNSQHTSNNSQHTYNNSQHTYNNSQHTSNNSQPTYNNSQHTYYIEHSESNDKNKDELKKDRAVPIKIGEMLPKGTDSVIQSINISVKQQTINNKVLDSFQIGSYSLPIKGQNIKPRGDYIKKDTKIFCKGEIFTHSHVSILVSTANYSIKVYRKPSIGVISFGDDLFQSSRGTINLLKKYDFNVTNYGTAINKPNDMKWALEKILKNNQFVLTHYNMVPNSVNLLKEVIVNDFDGIVHFDNLDMNPGPATFFSSLEYNGHVKYIFGLETKPTAAATACIQLVIPTLRKYSRHPKYEFPIINCVLDKSIPQTNDKRTQNYLMEVFLMQNDYHCQPVVSTIPDDVRGLLCANGILLTKGDLQHEANQSYPVIVF